MNKKKYEKPSMEVYDLPQQPQLLAGSGFGGGRNNPYGPPIPY